VYIEEFIPQWYHYVLAGSNARGWNIQLSTNTFSIIHASQPVPDKLLLLSTWDFPQPVLTAVTATTGLVLASMPSFFPSRSMLAPAALTRELNLVTSTIARSL
jgi:hypothetical protein